MWLHNTFHQISIHAPSRERQYSFDGLNRIKLISIHAPSRERHLPPNLKHQIFYFNPRSLTGATLLFHVFSQHIRISIHAPSRERLMHTYQIVQFSVFQSTLPHGSDRRGGSINNVSTNFNPRSLTGATASKWNTSTIMSIKPLLRTSLI